jgi:hypothetical protein
LVKHLFTVSIEIREITLPEDLHAKTRNVALGSGEQHMVTTLSRPVEMMERGTIPAWLRDEITAKKEQIANALREGGEITFDGPNGERVSIRADKQVVAA